METSQNKTPTYGFTIFHFAGPLSNMEQKVGSVVCLLVCLGHSVKYEELFLFDNVLISIWDKNEAKRGEKIEKEKTGPGAYISGV